MTAQLAGQMIPRLRSQGVAQRRARDQAWPENTLLGAAEFGLNSGWTTLETPGQPLFFLLVMYSTSHPTIQVHQRAPAAQSVANGVKNR